MHIAQLWMSQRNLRRHSQIAPMIKAIEIGRLLPRIVLVLCDDGEIQVNDGHHRLAAFWLSGRSRLEQHEYLLVEQDRYCRPRLGRISDLTAFFSARTEKKKKTKVREGPSPM